MKRTERIFIGVLFIALVTLSLSQVTQTLSAEQTIRTFSSSGVIKNIGVGVYLDSMSKFPFTSFQWGMLEPDSHQHITVYIKNEGNTAATLSMHSTNWTPSNAERYLDLIWDYDGKVIEPFDSIPVTFILNVSPDIEGITTFGFDLTIVATG